MKALFFDTGPIITLVMSRLVWLLPKLKEKFGGSFYITPAVKRELVDRPLTIKRFEFEALQVMKLIRDGVLEIYENVPQEKVASLQKLANSSFTLKGKTMDIIQAGELECVAAALELQAAIVIDERTLRLFIESNKDMKSLLEHRFKSKVVANPVKMKEFSAALRGVKIIRSIELAGVAYTLGYLDEYLPKLRNGKGILIESVLWATKFNGCAVTKHEVEELKAHLSKLPTSLKSSTNAGTNNSG
jgi:hypothetical protein